MVRGMSWDNKRLGDERRTLSQLLLRLEQMQTALTVLSLSLFTNNTLCTGISDAHDSRFGFRACSLILCV